MKHAPHGAKFQKIQVKRVDFLSAVLARLSDDVGTVLDLIDQRNEAAERKIGFWASIRMVMPIVEAVAGAVGETPQEVLGQHLGIATPYLAWDLFRHSLAHGDYLQTGEYEGKKVGWGVFLSAGHTFGDGKIHISVRSLYEALREYLETQIGKQDETLVDVEVGVLYSEPWQNVIDDFAKL